MNESEYVLEENKDKVSLIYYFRPLNILNLSYLKTIDYIRIEFIHYTDVKIIELTKTIEQPSVYISTIIYEDSSKNDSHSISHDEWIVHLSLIEEITKKSIEEFSYGNIHYEK